MSLSVSRLELAKVGRAEQVGPQACQHESLQDLGHGRQVGDRRSLFQQWKHLRSRIGQESFQSAVTGWRVWQWLV